MSIKWICTGKSEHGYQYKDAEGVLQNSSVIAIDFKAEIGAEGATTNELYETKPVLTEAGVEAFVGLQVYPQGFTVYADNRLTHTDAPGVIKIGASLKNMGAFMSTTVGDSFTTVAEGGTAGGGGAS